MKVATLNILGFLLLPAICFLSCTHPYEQEAQEALLMAEDNRAELEKVIAHYQDDPDPLKRKSAWFLIANMPYHGRFEGRDVEAYDSAYIRMAVECPERRDSTFKAEVGKIGFGFFDSKADILTMNADYLIKAIDKACEAWHESTWSKEYDEAYFFNYVLPYSILDEPLSDWRGYLDSAMPELRSNTVRSNRGVEMEAENAGFIPSLLSEATSASQGKMVMLNGADDAVTFKIEAPLTS